MGDSWNTIWTTAGDRKEHTKMMLSEMQRRYPNIEIGHLTRAVNETWKLGITLTEWAAKVESALTMMKRIDSAKGSHKEPDDEEPDDGFPP